MASHYDKPRTYKTEAVVLRQAPSGEADRLLTAYTLEFGALRLLARGLRRPRSRMAGHLEPLVYVSLQLARGRGIDSVTGADTLDGHTALRASLEGIARGLVCAELVEAFAPDEQPNRELFALLLRALELLDDGAGDLLLWHFAFHVLRLTGYMPELQRCVGCEKSVEPGGHLFSPALGGVVCPSCARTGAGAEIAPGGVALLPLPVTALKVLRFFRDHPYEEVQALRISADLAHDLERVQGSYIQYLLEREVRSAAFLSRLSRLLPTAR